METEQYRDLSTYIYPLKVVYQYRDVPDVCRAVRNSLHCCVEFKGFFKNPFTFFSLCCCVELKFFSSKNLSLSFHCMVVLSLKVFKKKLSLSFYCVAVFNLFSSRKLSLSFHCMAVLSLGDVRTSNIANTSDFHGSVCCLWSLRIVFPKSHQTFYKIAIFSRFLTLCLQKTSSWASF